MSHAQWGHLVVSGRGSCGRSRQVGMGVGGTPGEFR